MTALQELLKTKLVDDKKMEGGISFQGEDLLNFLEEANIEVPVSLGDFFENLGAYNEALQECGIKPLSVERRFLRRYDYIRAIFFDILTEEVKRRGYKLVRASRYKTDIFKDIYPGEKQVLKMRDRKEGDWLEEYCYARESLYLKFTDGSSYYSIEMNENPFFDHYFTKTKIEEDKGRDVTLMAYSENYDFVWRRDGNHLVKVTMDEVKSSPSDQIVSFENAESLKDLKKMADTLLDDLENTSDMKPYTETEAIIVENTYNSGTHKEKIEKRDKFYIHY